MIQDSTSKRMRFSSNCRGERRSLFHFRKALKLKQIIMLAIILVLISAANAQWTEPDSTQIQQPGPGAQAPWISNDNLRLYVSSPADLAVFTRASPDSPWGPMQMLPDHINLTPTQRCPAESPTGDTLYFIGDERTDCTSYGSYDVYFTVRTDSGWGTVQNPGPNVNSADREFSVGISRDGSILLVASARGGMMVAQLYWSDKQSDGTWGPLNSFGPGINDPIFESKEHPCLSPDNNSLFFWRMAPVLDDIWVSQRIDGQWQTAVRLPAPINGPGATMEEDPCLGADGRTLWFRKSYTSGYDYLIVVSVDTSVHSTNEQYELPHLSSPRLSTQIDSFGNINLSVSGINLRGIQEIQIHNILGRFVQTEKLQFTISNSQSIAILPSINLPSGTYIASLPLSQGTLNAKFIKVN
jgi:hypothetical protein